MFEDCPFCGGCNITFTDSNRRPANVKAMIHVHGVRAICLDCEAVGPRINPEMKHMARNLAKHAWNERVWNLEPRT